MFLDMALFAMLALRYKYVDDAKSDAENGIPIDTRKTFTNNAFQDDY
jgi:hypothetical protein